jgi:hypothetical protein
VGNKKILQKKFVAIGSGLLTYVKYGANTFKNEITDGHVPKFFYENKYTTLFIRPSWTDTVKNQQQLCNFIIFAYLNKYHNENT